MAKPRVKVPKTAKAGQVVEIKTLLSHKMETGLRKDKSGKIIPQNIIESFVAVFAGKTVFEAKPHSSISANPFIAFHMKVPATGELVMTWKDTSGATWTAKKTITVN
jgi:sulfur-oxidizing protein SoxZ